MDNTTRKLMHELADAIEAMPDDEYSAEIIATLPRDPQVPHVFAKTDFVFHRRYDSLGTALIARERGEMWSHLEGRILRSASNVGGYIRSRWNGRAAPQDGSSEDRDHAPDRHAWALVRAELLSLSVDIRVAAGARAGVFAPTERQESVLAALDGVAMPGKAISAETGIPENKIAETIKPMKDAGLVMNAPGQGYYRTDSPPHDWPRI